MNKKPVLSAEIVQEIFRKLYMRYGADWSGKWQGLDVDDMAQEWAQGLGDLAEHEVAHALEHLPDYPPNMPTFRRIAKEAPRPDRFAAPQVAQERKTYAQLARIAAYMAQTWAALGYHANADKARAECAELVELARDAGEQTQTAAALHDEAARDFAAAHERQLEEEKRGLTEPQRPQFDLDALLARMGTKKEDKRDWARIIAAKVERGGQVSDYAVKKARAALDGHEGERWLQNAPSAQFDDAEWLPW